MTDLNKFNSKSGFDFDLNNITSKIRLDFDTNVSGDPSNYILGINSNQTEFVLIDPNELTNTNITENTLDLSILDTGNLGNVRHYVFEKIVDPSVVGCSNCDSTTDVYSKFVKTGDVPNINQEIIAEFEISPSALHTLEVELVGHRKICNESGQCFDSWNKLTESFTPKKLIGNVPYPEERQLKELQNSFIDYTCCPCCDAERDHQRGIITLEQRDTICDNSNVYMRLTSAYPTFFDYCNNMRMEVLDETSSQSSLFSICDLIESSKKNYGTQINTLLSNCSRNII